MHRLLVCFGDAEHGPLGLGGVMVSSVTVPRVVMALAKYELESVAAGGAHTAVVTGEVLGRPGDKGKPITSSGVRCCHVSLEIH